MIGKVLRGRNARRLLYYLYGPGLANEHADPHLVAGFSDPAELEPERRPGGTRDFRRLAGLLEQPLAALAGPRVRQAGLALRGPRRARGPDAVGCGMGPGRGPGHAPDRARPRRG